MARISTGAAMAYPPGWKRAISDPGTATAVLRDAHGRYLGYLNITPRQSNERLANWASFRIEHNGDEGDRQVERLAVARRARFRTGEGSCVEDRYTTKTKVRYVEIACLVAGSRASTVIVGAAPPDAWAKVSPLIERSISAFAT